MTSFEVGNLLQVNPSSVNKWVAEGHLRAYRTPGGHRRIRVGDLLAFLDAQQYPVPRPLEQARKRRLVVVDDDPDQLRALARLLKPNPQVDLQTVDNGIDALVLIGSWKPHLVILDVYMPELDGLEVCRRLRANPDTRNVGVVVASGQMTEALEKSALEAGARRAVAKPIPLATILSELMPADQPAL